VQCVHYIFIRACRQARGAGTGARRRMVEARGAGENALTLTSRAVGHCHGEARSGTARVRATEASVCRAWKASINISRCAQSAASSTYAFCTRWSRVRRLERSLLHLAPQSRRMNSCAQRRRTCMACSVLIDVAAGLSPDVENPTSGGDLGPWARHWVRHRCLGTVGRTSPKDPRIQPRPEAWRRRSEPREPHMSSLRSRWVVHIDAP
jgi:hypothetical protein